MSFPKKVRFHTGAGDFKPAGTERSESFATFCRANGGLSREEGVALLDKWVNEGAIRRRDDGGFDVIKVMPRQQVKK